MLNLKQMAGFEFPSYWQRFRPELKGDSGDISEDDLNSYISSGGQGKQFSLFCMESGTMQDKLDAASRKATELGLKLDWSIADVQVTRAGQIIVDQFQTPAFLTDAVIGRHKDPPDAAQAQTELCAPLEAGVFFFKDSSFTGFSAHLRDATCVDGTDFPPDGATGALFRDRLPDFVWQWVPVHELGHTFGLCHVDGLDRIMVSLKDHSWWGWSLIPNYWLHGEPIFTLEEAKRVWDYIIANFSPSCLAGGK
jgi:hypothetical protein